METIEYCQMRPASANPDTEDTHRENQEDKHHYENPGKLGKDSKAGDYARLRQSKMDDQNYTLINVKNRDAERAQLKKMNDLVRAMCCVVGYVTFTFVITSGLLAYTIWSVTDLRRGQVGTDDLMNGRMATLSSNITGVQSYVSRLLLNVTRLETRLNLARYSQICQALGCCCNNNSAGK